MVATGAAAVGETASAADTLLEAFVPY